MTFRFDVSGRRWQAVPSPVLSRHHKDWLTRGGALTRHLAALGRVSVRVVAERVMPADADQCRAIGVPLRTPMWARDVILLVDGEPVVVAHSVTPLAYSRSVWQAMRRLRTRPLADLLYHDPAVSRSVLVSSPLGPRHLLHGRARHDARDPLVGANPRARLWARRSVFVRHGAPLLVTEAFLPRFWRRLQAGQRAHTDD
ncbi:chorismate--pyruvate lyase family protein [Pandoraea pulmonicola]|uniref:Probable chorismate pyruvate-lyase n=1 Tax=Pandoraea pulmonicola TaxID=93221 RepID=A0AAJ4Z9H7_PANPU|nr:chorismate lyase [Pandoraea pulmonicola]AJC21847.1 chorismate--pyruvate lyase [Pandoraea pulmonicola]SUA89234.1 Chorismate--pyruvate lyase [Pandoraea pulmonicola]